MVVDGVRMFDFDIRVPGPKSHWPLIAAGKSMYEMGLAAMSATKSRGESKESVIYK